VITSSQLVQLVRDLGVDCRPVAFETLVIGNWPKDTRRDKYAATVTVLSAVSAAELSRLEDALCLERDQVVLRPARTEAAMLLQFVGLYLDDEAS
jgi:hypothetical protein